jgi:hypothetical protein
MYQIFFRVVYISTMKYAYLSDCIGITILLNLKEDEMGRACSLNGGEDEFI